MVSIVVLTIAVTALAAVGLHNGVVAGAQRRSTDFMLPAAADSKHVVVVGFDHASIKIGNPLPRQDVAVLVDNLKALGAKVIVFDVVYGATKDGDGDFARAMEQAGNVVLGVDGEAKPGGPLGMAKLVNATAPAPDLGTAYRIGYVEMNPDPSDGVNRSTPLVVEAPDGSFVPSLALASVMAFRDVTGPPTVRPGGIQIGDRLVPTDSSQSMLLNFTGSLSHRSDYVPAADVIAGKVKDPGRIAGKIVFVGAVAATLGDDQLAPVHQGGKIPGVFLHANAANTILTGDYLQRSNDTQTLVWVALLTWLIGVAVLMLPLWISPVIAAALGGGYFTLFVFRFNQGTVLNVVYPLGSVVLAFVGALALRYFGETRQRRRVTALFAQYVPETVAQQLVDEDRATSAAEGERLDMTVLFCDLRGFTALSEKLEPTTVRVMLNHYYDRVTDLVLAMSGTLMKYVGDEVFAVWGAPIPSTDHPARALQCAIAIQDLVPQLNRELLEMGAPEVAFGIGLNTGEAVAAHFGGGRRRQYDVVGDTVNVGARLCSAAGRGEIILSDAVLSRVPDPPPVEPVGPIALKGVSRERQLWRVVRPISASVAASEPVAVAVAAAPGADGARGGSEDGAEQGRHSG